MDFSERGKANTLFMIHVKRYFRQNDDTCVLQLPTQDVAIVLFLVAATAGQGDHACIERVCVQCNDSS